MSWILHNETLFNLDKFTKIIRGDEDEIILSNFNELVILTFPSKQICLIMFQVLINNLHPDSNCLIDLGNYIVNS